MEKVIDGIIYSEDMSEVLGVESKSIKVARVAEGVKIIRSEAFKDCTELTEVYLPSSIERIWYQVWKNCNSLLTIHFGSDFARLVTKWFNFLSAQVDFDCEKDSKTYKLIKRSSVLRSHIKELSMMSAKTEKIKQVQSASAEALLSSAFEQYEDAVYQLIASRKSGIIVLVALKKFCGIFSFGVDYEKWLSKIPTIIQIFSDQERSAEEVFSLLKKNKISLAELPSNKQPTVKLSADLVLFAKGRLYPLKVPNLKSIEIFGIKSIEPCAFQDAITLEAVKLPDCLESIGYLAFKNCASLKSVNIPEGIKEIEWSTFDDCPALSSIALPSSVEKIGENAFEGAESLCSIFIPDTIQKIEKDAFKNTHIENLGSTFKIKSNYYRVMNGKENLEFTIKDGFAFDKSTLLYPALLSENMVIPEGTTSIEEDAFEYCHKKVKTLTFPKSLCSIGRHAFFYFFVEKIEYKGKVKDWKRIAKGEEWNHGLIVDFVQCSDGEVEL